jgi:hypothetical protein
MKMGANERIVRMQMRAKRKHRFGQPLCDLCKEEVATDWHHVWTRYLTMGNEMARLIASGPDMTALLCRECHAVADDPSNRNKIILNLYSINGDGNPDMGYSKMSLAEMRLIKALGHPITWSLLPPDELEDKINAEESKNRVR